MAQFGSSRATSLEGSLGFPMNESVKKSQTLVEEALALPGRGGNGTVKVAQVRQKRCDATVRTGLLSRGSAAPAFEETGAAKILALKLGGRLRAIFFVPRRSRLQPFVQRLDVAHALFGQPIFKRLIALLCIDGDAFLPGGATAEHAVEAGLGLGGHLQAFQELVVAHPRA